MRHDINSVSLQTLPKRCQHAILPPDTGHDPGEWLMKLKSWDGVYQFTRKTNIICLRTAPRFKLLQPNLLNMRLSALVL